MEFVYLILAFISGIVGCAAFIWAAKWYALRIVRREAGARGNAVKADMESRLMSFMLEVKNAHDAWKAEGGTDLKEFGMKKVIPIGLRYPDVIMKQGKNLMKMLEGEGFGGLEGIL